MRVGDRMQRQVVTVEPETAIHAAWHLMKECGIRHLPVVSAGHLRGIVTKRDLLRVWPSAATTLEVREISHRLARVPVREAMTFPVITVTPRTPLSEAARLMREKKIGALPVLDGDKLAGILTESDLVKTLIDLLPEASPPA